MAEIKNSFLKSKMNQDLDDRLIPNGEYRYANNISVGKSEADDIGALQNILGNELLPLTTAPIEEAGMICIGAFMDNQNNRIFQFLTDYTDPSPTNITLPTSGNMKITMYNFDSPTNYVTLVEGLFLNFAKNNEFRITGVNLVEGLLFWTDNRNQPRKINVSSALNPNYYTNEEQISVAKYAPVNPISLYKKESATVVSGSGTTYILSNIDSLACTIGTVSGTPPNPYTATITTAVVDGFAGFSVGDVIAGNNGSGSFGLGQLVITSLINSTSVKVSSTAIFSAGTVSITLKYPSLGGLQSGATVLSVSPTGVQGLTGSDYAVVVSMSNTTLTLYEPTVIINNNDILTFLISTMSDRSSVPDWPGDPVFLEDRYVRFSYRFKYDDNEYSLMAPFTQIVYIPKQKGYFIAGNEVDAYRSTVINWFENNINNIELIVPLPDKIGNLTNSYKIKEIDILYKESDSLAIKVFETLPVSAINTAANTNNNYYIQPYQSQKPYKTLTEDQTTRVYDKVPVRAKAQESSGNRIIYGNYYDKYTCPSSINYNISVQPKLLNGTNFIEYPNHTLKKNRNYQVGFILADKFGRQSPVILSTVDLLGTSLGGGQFAKGSTVYSSYENSVLFDDVRTWFGDTLILYLNTIIDQQKDIPAGKSGLYAIPTSNSGFAITASTITDTVYTYTLDITAATNTPPVEGDILRGYYTDYVSVLSDPVPTVNPDEYSITTSGRVNDIYNYNDPGGGILDIKFSYIYNPIGWYSYKVVVKQQEQDYYNVYLPGMLDGYPKGQTSGSQVVYSGTGATATSTLQNGINPTQFPVSETGNTSHIVLINDNINKVPRDLAEVGPDQKQYRSSVQLYGRVENTEDSVTITGDTPAYSSKTSTITYTIGPPGSGLNEDWALIKAGDGIQCTQASAPVPDTTPPVVPLSGATMPNPYKWLGDTVVVSNTVVGTTGTILISSANWVLRAAQDPNGQDYVTFIISRAENRQYFPTRKADTVTSIATATEFNFLSSSADNLAGTAGLNFYQLQTNPLIGRVSTVKKIGVSANDMVPFLSVYETRPDQSILELFWETATTGLISDLNADVLTGFDGPSSFGSVNYEHFEFQDPNGFGSVQGEENSKYVTDNFVVLNQQGIILPNTTVTLLSADDNAGASRLGDFGLEAITVGLNATYRLFIKKPSEGAGNFVFNNNALAKESYVFTFLVTDNDNPTTSTNLSISGRLGNNQPNITTSVVDYNILQSTTTFATLEAVNGSYSNAITGLKWSITSGNEDGYFSLDQEYGTLSLINNEIPLAGYELVIKVQDAVNTDDWQPLEPADVGDDYGTQFDTITLNINVGDNPVPIWLRPEYTSTQVINGGNDCEGADPGYAMVYIGPKEDFGVDYSYLPEIPDSDRQYQFAENIEIVNATGFGETIWPTGLTEGEYRVKIKLTVPAPGLCDPLLGFANFESYFDIYLYRRQWTESGSLTWELVKTTNNKQTPYKLPKLIVTTDDPPLVFGREKAITTSFTIEADKDIFYEWAVGVEMVNSPDNAAAATINPFVEFYGQDANYSYGATPTPPFSNLVVTPYTYYTGLEDNIGYPSAVAYTDQDATRGLVYDSPVNEIASGSINNGFATVTFTLTTVNSQIVPGLACGLSTPGIGYNGVVVGVNQTTNAITIQLPGIYLGPPISLIGQNASFEMFYQPTVGVLYANTEEGTEVKRFYTDDEFTNKWTPPIANRFYVFQTSKDYNPGDVEFIGGTSAGQLKYTKFPYYCAQFNEEGEVIEQTTGLFDSQTAWNGMNEVNTGLLGEDNYAYNILYYEEPFPP